MTEFGDKIINMGTETVGRMPKSFQNWLLVKGGQCLTNPNPKIRALGGIFMLIVPPGTEYVDQVIGVSGSVSPTSVSSNNTGFEMQPSRKLDTE